MDISTLILYLVFVAAAFAALQGCRYFIDDLREETRVEVSRLRRVRFAEGFSPWLRDILLAAPIRRFDNLVQTSGVNARTEFILLGMILGTAIIMSIANQFLTPFYPLLGLVLGVGLGIALPYAVILRLRSKRMAKLTLQLPETLGMIVRSLRAGHPIGTCIALVAKEMPEPIGPEFKRVADAMLFNLALRDALTRLADRLYTVHELQYIVTAIRIQAISGGNLAEILESLSDLMREQQKLKMKIKTFSAEGRLSANVLAVLPFAMFVLINVINPSIYREAFGVNPIAINIALGVAVLLVVIGKLIARRVVKIRV
jgi:tight adherence protein B